MPSCSNRFAAAILEASILRLRPPVRPCRAGRFQPCPGLLNSQVAFHLSQTGHNMEKEAARRGISINLIGQGFEVYAALFQVTDDVHQVFYTASQPVELSYNQAVIFP